ncbi:MAG: NADP-dependent isocitrate dehydrogenase [Microthrixaceae bacterium]
MSDRAQPTASTIIYTLTDEAPALATRSLLPIISAFAGASGVAVETRDISLAGRILAAFADRLPDTQRRDDHLAELGELATRPEANIIKLPNISASLPQLQAAIAELQADGYELPDYPDGDEDTPEAQAVRDTYSTVMGSAVNPVLREGNSDRRAPAAVKAFARNHPHSMGAWSSDSQTRVRTMAADDFRSTEQSATIAGDDTLSIRYTPAGGAARELRPPVEVAAGTIVDASVMGAAALEEFLAAAIAEAKADGVLWSLHLKATMMKVSDPIIFGHAVRAFFPELFARHGDALAEAGFNPNNGLASLESALDELDAETRTAVEAELAAGYAAGPPLAMVNSDQGITNLHVPSDVIIDASMPAMLRTSGQMWGPDGEPADTLAVIPDHSYAGVYAEVIAFSKEHGAFDPTTMGSVPNVGLMAQKAEEYGSHDKTFEIEADGVVEVLNGAGEVVFAHQVGAGDIWRMCLVADTAVRDWVGLAVRRARATGAPAVFWLDETRAHDAQLIARVNEYLEAEDTDGLDLRVLAPEAATRFSLERIVQGLDTISVTGNVLRDYLTDLFPILEVGTSAKMLSIVPLMAGGGLFETGAGGSAPKHVQQFVAENHLRWDSLGEFLALGASLEHLADHTDNARARLLARTLDDATARVLEEGRSPSRKVNELDNRGSHFYLALYWAEALAAQADDAELAATFAPLAKRLADDETTIVDELNAVQGRPVDLGGYYWPNPDAATQAMRPSATLNTALDAFAAG